MKKIITLLLALTLTFSIFAGCKKKESTSESERESSPTSEIVSESSPSSQPESQPESEKIPEGSTTGEKLAEALSSQISNATSLRVEYEIHEVVDSIYNYYQTDENDATTSAVESYYFEEKTEVDAVLSIDANGNLDAKVKYKISGVYYKGESLEVLDEGTTYIIDNVTYSWRKEANAWVKDDGSSEDVTQILETLKSIKTDDLISEEEKSQLYAVLGEYVNTTFDVKDYKGTLTIDGAPIANGFLDYLKNIDTTTKTVSSFIEDGLKLIDKDLTTAIALAKVKEVASLTVSQAVANIDSWLSSNYQTSLQDLYSRIVKTDGVAEMIVDAQGIAGKDRELAIAQVKNAKIVDMIEDVKDVPLYDLIMTYAYEGNPYASIDETFAQIESAIALPIAEFEQNLGIMPIISMICAQANNVRYERLDAKIDVQFTGVFQVDSVVVEAGLQGMETFPSEVEGKYDVTNMSNTIKLKLYEISNERKDIALPTGDRVMDFFASGYYESADGKYDGLWLSVSEEEAKFELSVEHPSGIYVEYEAIIPKSALENPRIEVAPELITLYVDRSSSDITIDKSIIVVIDGDTFTVEQVPESGISNYIAKIALQSIQDGEGKYVIDPNLGITIDLWTGSNYAQIFFADTFPISTIVFEGYTNYETGELVCTVTGYHTDGYLIDAETGGGYIGSIPEQIPIIFTNVEFSFYLTEDGVIKCDNLPQILEQYIKK